VIRFLNVMFATMQCTGGGRSASATDRNRSSIVDGGGDDNVSGSLLAEAGGYGELGYLSVLFNMLII
jgi:hypothetical protein